MITKVEQITELAVKIPDEVVEQMGWEEGQKLFVSENDDGSILISEGEKIEIDLNDFSKESLMLILSDMNDKDITFNEWVENALRSQLELDKTKDL